MRSFLCPVIGEKTAGAAAMAAKERSAFYFSKTVFSPSVSKRRSPLRKRPGFNKPISFHFLRLGLEWEGLVYCGAFARTIKRILPPRGAALLKRRALYVLERNIDRGRNVTPDNPRRCAPFGAASAFAEAMEGLGKNIARTEDPSHTTGGKGPKRNKKASFPL